MPSRAAAEGTSAPSASPTRSARDARARLAAAATRVASDGARDGDGAGDRARDGEDGRVTRGERPSSAAVGGVAAAKDAPLRAMRRRRFGGRYFDARFAASGAGSRAARGCRPAAAARGDDAIGSALATTTDIAWARYPLACRGAGRCDEERRRREQRRGDGYRFLQTPFRDQSVGALVCHGGGGGAMADDTEKAIIYAFDQSGAVAADLRERALSYLRDLQVRARAPTSSSRRRVRWRC